MDAADRFLVVALEEVLGGVSPPDVRERVLAATRRVRLLRRAVAVAASLLVLLGGGLAMLLVGEGEAPVPADPGEVALRERLDGLVLEMRVAAIDVDPTLPDAFERRKRAETAAAELLSELSGSPELWAFVRPRLRAVPAVESRRDVAARLLRVLARDPAHASDDLIAERLAADRDILDEDTLLLLGERGFGPAVTRLGAALDEGRPWIDDVFVASFFGLRGDPRGERILTRAVSDRMLLDRSASRFFAASAALARLGEERVWTASLRRLSEAIERRLGAGQQEVAVLLLVAAEYFAPAATRGERVSLVRIGYAISDRHTELRKVLATPDAIRERLRLLTR